MKIIFQLKRGNEILTLSLQPELAKRAAFFARLHRKKTTNEWLETIIRERLDFEKAAFTELKEAVGNQ